MQVRPRNRWYLFVSKCIFDLDTLYGTPCYYFIRVNERIKNEPVEFGFRDAKTLRWKPVQRKSWVHTDSDTDQCVFSCTWQHCSRGGEQNKTMSKDNSVKYAASLYMCPLNRQGHNTRVDKRGELGITHVLSWFDRVCLLVYKSWSECSLCVVVWTNIDHNKESRFC